LKKERGLRGKNWRSGGKLDEQMLSQKAKEENIRRRKEIHGYVPLFVGNN
jgi:hypothetical protein